MTVLGAVVFGGLLVLGVLWLLVTAPDSETDPGWDNQLWADHGDDAARGGILTGAR